VTASLTFLLTLLLTLPPAGTDRLGATSQGAGLGSGLPLLAWVRGRGWVTGQPGQTVAEFVASEAAVTEVTVLAPAQDTVLMTGRPAPRRGPAGDYPASPNSFASRDTPSMRSSSPRA
jgi:hypothetical protein